MRVAIVHNRYRTSAPSGEDIAVLNERGMLERHGVEVVSFDRCNDDLDDSSWGSKGVNAVSSLWSPTARAELRRLLQEARPDLVHVHNTFAMISPSVYGVCREAGVPVVQTLHNFRLLCPNGLFLRGGKPCEDCVDRSLLQSVRHRCYRNSRAATATLASMLVLHRMLGTYLRHVDRYIALTRFAREKFVRGGLPAGKLTVKPNFLPDPPKPGDGAGGYVLFVGRLLEGKGTETLLSAWRTLKEYKLKIAGDGALRGRLEGMAREWSLNVEFLGSLDRGAVLAAISRAAVLIVPSEWYEGFPMVIAEAYACGTPVLASRIGSLDELVLENETGSKFAAGDPADLAAALRSMLGRGAATSPAAAMRKHARAYFETHLTEESNFGQLMSIYQSAMQSAMQSAEQRVERSASAGSG